MVHGTDLMTERIWSNNSSYHCIYGSNYNYVRLSEWNIENISSCKLNCGLLEGLACPGKIQAPNIFFFSVFLTFGTLTLR